MASRTLEILEEIILRPASERSAALDAYCAGEPGLRAEVERLLRAHDSAGAFLASATRSEVGDPLSPGEAPWAHGEEPGAMVGRYKLLQRIGEGGFGVVFMAEQQAPVVRRVALKIIKLGMDTRQVIARFEAERQALAMMDHPGIARVLDAGATEMGRPYFVMELVRGDPITEYCDRENLSIRERLELFGQVCSAVQHAHQKGVIHRDIKPDNILVTVADGGPVPKVIDFGIAKAISGRLTEKTLFTEFRQLIGTPEYMSPEQADASGVDVDTRTDVYSLGVLLYELLTGTTPLDARTLRSASFGEIQRMIREEEPPRPSTRMQGMLSSCGAAIERSRSATVAEQEVASGASESFKSEGDLIGPERHADAAREGAAYESDALGAPDARKGDASDPTTIARRRRSDPKRLTGALRGDLDWIVMKALEKNRARRYETASALATDVRRYLTNQPVEAGPPSRRYRTQKFVRRNRGGVLAAGLVAVALVLGLGGTSWGVVWATAEAARAAQRARELELVSDFLADMLADVDPTAAGILLSRDVLRRFEASLTDVLESDRQAEVEAFSLQWSRINKTDTAHEFIHQVILGPAVAAIDEQFKDQPLVDAQLRQAIASRYRGLGDYDAAMPLQVRALETRRRILGDDHPDTIASISEMGILLRVQGDFTEAEPYYRDALEKRRRVLGKEHPDTLTSINNMGSLLRAQDRLDKAEECYRDALEKRRRVLGEEDPDTLVSIGNLGALLRAQGKPEQAKPLYREAMEGFRRVLGEEHPHTLTSINNMASLLLAEDDFTGAEQLYREALETRRRILGDEHPDTLTSIGNMGALFWAQDKFEEAERYYREALENRRRYLREDHPSTLRSMVSMGVLLSALGRHQETLDLLAPAERDARKAFTDNNAWRLASFLTVLARARAGLMYDAEQFSLAEAELVEAHPIFVTCRGEAHKDTLACVQGLIDLYTAWNSAEPGKGYDIKANEWNAKLDELSGPTDAPGS